MPIFQESTEGLGGGWGTFEIRSQGSCVGVIGQVSLITCKWGPGGQHSKAHLSCCFLICHI